MRSALYANHWQTSTALWLRSATLVPSVKENLYALSRRPGRLGAKELLSRAMKRANRSIQLRQIPAPENWQTFEFSRSRRASKVRSVEWNACRSLKRSLKLRRAIVVEPFTVPVLRAHQLTKTRKSPEQIAHRAHVRAVELRIRAGNFRTGEPCITECLSYVSSPVSRSGRLLRIKRSSVATRARLPRDVPFPPR